VPQLDVLADPNVPIPPLAGDLDVDPALQRVPVGLVIGLDVADVAPVAGRQVPEEGHPTPKHLGEDVAAPIDDGGRWQEIEHLRLENVDAGVDLVGEDLTPGGLFQEPVDGAVGVSDHHPELQRARDRGQDDGRRRHMFAVKGDRLGQVDVGQGVAADDDKGLVQVGLRVLDAPGRPQRRILHDVGDVHPEVRAVTKVVPNRGAQVLERDHHIADAMLAQQAEDVLHHRLADDRHQGLRQPARQRPQPGPLATRHDHCFHWRSPRVAFFNRSFIMP